MKERINDIIKKCTDDYFEVDENTTFSELGADSLDMTEIIVDCELEFDISIPDSMIKDLRTVKELYDIVEQLIKL